MKVICRNCGEVFSNIIREDYLDQYPLSADDWLRELDRECNCCDNPDYHYEN